MLKEIFIENYKSLKNAKVEFKDGLNIIIGKNGSGKSNLLEFINKAIGTELFLKSDYQNLRFPDYNFSYTFNYIGELGSLIELTINLHNDQILNEKKNRKKILITKRKISDNEIFFTRSFSDGTDKRLESAIDISTASISEGISEFSSVIFILQNVSGLLSKYLKFSIPSDMPWLDHPCTMTVDEFGVISGGFTGIDNLFSFGFQDILQTSLIYDFARIVGDKNISTIKSFLFDTFDQYKENSSMTNLLLSHSPIEDIKISNNANIYLLPDNILLDNLTFDFKIEGNWVPWSYLSDGTKRLFYLISEIASCQNGVILIEEPELGIHPHQLYRLMEFIKEQSRTKQIIISTHSPLILDTLEADELDRITIAKIENGKSQFHKLTNEEMEKARVYMHEEMDLSFYWLHSDMEAE